MHFAVHERLPESDRERVRQRERGEEREGKLSASKTINNSIKLYNDVASVCT